MKQLEIIHNLEPKKLNFKLVTEKIQKHCEF
jgi:hypothetical protein